MNPDVLYSAILGCTVMVLAWSVHEVVQLGKAVERLLERTNHHGDALKKLEGLPEAFAKVQTKVDQLHEHFLGGK